MHIGDFHLYNFYNLTRFYYSYSFVTFGFFIQHCCSLYKMYLNTEGSLVVVQSWYTGF